jgi:hypothetical protein
VANDATATRGQTAAIANWFETMVTKSMMKEFPCAEVTTASGIADVLNLQRQRSLLGGDVDADLKSLADAVGLYDYLISLQVTPLGGRTVLRAFCMSAKSSKTVAMDVTASGDGPDAAVDACGEFAERFIRKLAYLEICPYKGPVQVTVHSRTNKEEKEEYPVYCNQSDQMYRKRTTITKATDTDWNLQKTGRRSASGTVTHTTNERTEIVEEDGCHKCPSGRQGGRISTQVTTATETIDGLSEESRREGRAQKDARITLEFKEDDTFTVFITATSRDGTRHERTEEKAEGTCDTKTGPPKVVDGKVNVPLPGRFGPFAGKPQDKVLHGRTTETKKDPVTEEEVTTGIDFELQRN